MNKDYIYIYFNEDGGVNIQQKSKQQIEQILEELAEEARTEGYNPLNEFITSADKEIDSGYVANKRYMIIRGDIVSPKVAEVITKLTI